MKERSAKGDMYPGKTVFYLALLALFCQTTIAQTDTDSIELKIKNLPQARKFEVLAQYINEFRTNSPHKSLHYAQLMLSLANKYHNEKAKAEAYISMGNIFFLQDHYTRALDYYLQSLEKLDSLNLENIKANVMNNIGAVYFQMKYYDQSITYFQKSLEVKKRNNDSVNIANLSSNIGSIYFINNDFDKAYHYFSESLKIHERLENEKGMADVSNNLGELFHSQSNFIKALLHFKRALSFYTRLSNTNGMARANVNIGNTYIDLRAYDKAIKYLETGLKQAGEIKSKEIMIECYQSFARAFEQQKNFKKANFYNKLIIQGKDSIFHGDLAKQIAHLQTRYETEKKEKENDLLKKNMTIQSLEVQRLQNMRKAFIILLVLLTGIAVLLFRLNQLKKVTNRKISAKSAELQDLNRELQKLNATKDKFFSLISHEIKNPFNQVLGFADLTMKRRENLTNAQIDKNLMHIYHAAKNGTELLENILEWSRAQTGNIQFNPSKVSLNKVIKRSLELFEPSARSKNITFQKDVKDDIYLHADEYMLYTIFRNLISNALKFSFPGGRIKIATSVKDQLCWVKVTDNGAGIEKDKIPRLFDLDHNFTTRGTNNEKGTGLGLSICREFIQSHGGELHVESEPGVETTFSFSMYLYTS